MGNGSAPAGLKLKERVRKEELTPQAAMNLLRQTDPSNANGSQNATYRWLLRQGAL